MLWCLGYLDVMNDKAFDEPPKKNTVKTVKNGSFASFASSREVSTIFIKLIVARSRYFFLVDLYILCFFVSLGP